MRLIPLSEHQKTLKTIKDGVASVREQKRRLDHARELAKDPKYSDTYRTEDARLKKGDAKAKVAPQVAAAYAAIDAVKADLQANWSREAYLKRPHRFKPLPGGLQYESPTFLERWTLELLADIRDVLAAADHRALVEKMTPAELAQEFATTWTEQRFLAAVQVLREADTRKAGLATASDEQLKMQAGVVGLSDQLRRWLQTDAPAPPELAEAEALFADVHQQGEYLTSAVQSLDTGDDPGIQAERVADMRRRNLTNDEIRAELAAANTAA